VSTTISLANPQYATSFLDLLRPRSVFPASGVPILTTDSDSLIYPQLATDATVAWYAEGGTITASDPGFAAGTAVPRKIAVRTEYSNEVADDSSPELEGVLRNVLAARAATVLDIAAFEGTGVGNQPTGMGNIASIGNVSAAGLSSGDIRFAGTAVVTLEGNSAPRPYTWVGGTSMVRRLREVRVGSGGAVDEYLFPVGSEEVPPLWGASGFIAPHLNGGTAYFFSPSSMYLVNRIAAFDIEVDRSRLFDRDMSEMRLKARVDFAYPYPTAINRATAVPA
jgi:HK97 family phage major capsid protein